MIDPQQLERSPNCVVGLSSQCCSRHAGKNGLLCAVLLLGSLAHLVYCNLAQAIANGSEKGCARVVTLSVFLFSPICI